MQDPELLREYAIDDPSMLMYARDMHVALQQYLADFQAFDPMFDATYLNVWDNDMFLASHFDTDALVENIQTHNTNELEKEMEACRLCFQDAKFFIEKAFPNNPQKWKVFGFADYDATRKSPEKMLVFMLLLHAATTQNASQLASVNFSQTNIDAIWARKTQLELVIISRTLYLRGRSLKTRERVLLLNKVWSYLSELSAASRIIYRDNYALYQIFLLPESKDADRGIDIKGRVLEASTGENLKGVQAEIVNSNLKAATNAWGFFRFGKLEKGKYTLTLSLPEYIPLTVEVEFDGKEMVEGEWEMEKR